MPRWHVEYFTTRSVPLSFCLPLSLFLSLSCSPWGQHVPLAPSLIFVTFGTFLKLCMLSKQHASTTNHLPSTPFPLTLTHSRLTTLLGVLDHPHTVQCTHMRAYEPHAKHIKSARQDVKATFLNLTRFWLSQRPWKMAVETLYISFIWLAALAKFLWKYWIGFYGRKIVYYNLRYSRYIYSTYIINIKSV